MPLNRIETAEVIAITDALINTPSEANHAFTAARTFFRWAVKRRLIDRSPLDGCDLPASEGSRDRVLTKDELCAIWQACDAVEPNLAALTRCLILTGQRAAQFVELRGEQVDRNNATISWTADQMKGAKPHTLPIGALPLSLIPDRDGLLFPKQNGTPYHNRSTAKEWIDRACSLPHWTFHDLRRVWATIAAEELDVPPHIIESVLAHQSGSRVSRIYNRARYLEPMRDAMQKWESWLQALLSTTEGTNA